MNTPIGLFGLSSFAREVWMRLAIISRRMALADDALVERVGELEHRLDLVLHHPADRNAGPVGDHATTRLARPRWARSAAFRLAARRACPCSSCSSASSFAFLGASSAFAESRLARRCRGRRRWLGRRLRRARRPACRPRAACARSVEDLIDQRLLVGPALLELGQPRRARVASFSLASARRVGRHRCRSPPRGR